MFDKCNGALTNCHFHGVYVCVHACATFVYNWTVVTELQYACLNVLCYLSWAKGQRLNVP